MIIDFNAHIGQMPGSNVDYSIDSLKESMKSSDIELSVVSDIGTAFDSSQNKLQDYYGNDIVRFFSAAPETDISQIGFSYAGLRIYPTYQNWDFTSKNWLNLLFRASEDKWILQIYLRLLDPRVMMQTSESTLVLKSIVETISNFNDIQFVISGSHLSEINEHIEIFSRDNVWIEIANIQYPMNSLQKLLEIKDIKRILFGSNMPYFYTDSNAFRIENTPISESEKILIYKHNAEQLLGIKVK